MKRLKFSVLTFAIASVVSSFSYADMPETVIGPDKALSVTVSLTEGKPFYEVSYHGELFLEASPLGLNSSIGDFSKGLTYIDTQFDEISEHYTLNRAKVSKVHYQC